MLFSIFSRSILRASSELHKHTSVHTHRYSELWQRSEMEDIKIKLITILAIRVLSLYLAISLKIRLH